MALSRQEATPTNGRSNQKERTRRALLEAALELVREGRSPSMPDAADRALVSVATAYRYFSSAEELWFEASLAAAALEPALSEIQAAVEGSGDDPAARVETLIRTLEFRMLDDQVPFRRLAKAALEQWFSQAEAPEADRRPVRAGRRNRQIAIALQPLRGTLADADVDRLARALGLVIGTEAMTALIDGVGLEVADAKDTLLDAGRWMLAGALAEMHQRT
jgi:AcrR family transcriptional regulator